MPSKKPRNWQTTLWRRGMSHIVLCNACGLRYKAKQAREASDRDEAGSSTQPSYPTPPTTPTSPIPFVGLGGARKPARRTASLSTAQSPASPPSLTIVADAPAATQMSAEAAANALLCLRENTPATRSVSSPPALTSTSARISPLLDAILHGHTPAHRAHVPPHRARSAGCAGRSLSALPSPWLRCRLPTDAMSTSRTSAASDASGPISPLVLDSHALPFAKPGDKGRGAH
ncbi:hypothetical protein Q5752_006591 [Cryptotrichosporon argae]